MIALNNAETSAGFPSDYAASGAILLSGLCARAVINTYNHAVEVSLLTSPTRRQADATWQSPIFVAPGERMFDLVGIFGISARSAVASEPARVTLELYAEEETYQRYLPALGDLADLAELLNALRAAEASI